MESLETSIKTEKGYLFVGWSNPERDAKFCIDTKENKKFIYKTYKWLTGKIDTYRFRK